MKIELLFMNENEFYLHLKKNLGHLPTPKQEVGLQLLSSFIVHGLTDHIFVLKGYAGTGKTTLIKTLVNNCWRVKKKLVLTAPTGRAAKVISTYSNQHAQTIHRKIYYPKSEQGGGVSFITQQNKHTNTIFIVDEASMVPDIPTGDDLFAKGSLLDDLVEYVYAGENCQLIFIGDTAQLPPVKADLSPALSEKKLELQFGLKIISLELDEVVRQDLESDILINATRIRKAISEEFYENFQFKVSSKNDLIRLIDGYEILDAINDAYNKNGHQETAIIVRSNKRANLYNQQIRSRILFQEDEISTGDYLMVVKNNYFWLDPKSDASFIANGDIIEILEIFSRKELYGFRFAEVKVQMVDYPSMPAFETVILLDTLTTNAPSLTFEQSNTLYQEVLKDYENETSKYKRFIKVKQNKFFNALQVKFSYAITCHKSQGGQWDTVFVEQPYLSSGIDKDYLRWLYTAITRAKSKLYLIGFNDDFFEDLTN